MDAFIVLPGTRAHERALHHQLRLHRRQGEWFAFNLDALDVIRDAIVRGLPPLRHVRHEP